MARRKRKIRKVRVFFSVIIVILMIVAVFKAFPLIFSDFKSLEKVIVIDAGHGGTDPGTIGIRGNYEKDINLQISEKLKSKLEASGYKVVLTRDSDEYIDNLARAELANKKRGRVFISIHGNALADDNVTKGIQVLYYPNRSSTIGDLNNNELAQIMINSLINGTGATDKGIVERENLIVLNQTKMPAIIIEYGFLSNEMEEKLLLTDEYQYKIVDSVIDGLEEYLFSKGKR
ncbi:MAG TPA: N-acetylmuramoyl-L-alanine amidase [Epulopiscium sp.]|nr:N-acetylmuramoyl-L-alanine amidase [Candidatus Epulonipiscium sp.]